MKNKTFNVLSKEQQSLVLGGKLPGGRSHGTIVGWSYTNGQYYADIQHDGGEIVCGVPWGQNEPIIGSNAGE
jgi:hypothetical protein